jgi:hypothetical protein
MRNATATAIATIQVRRRRATGVIDYGDERFRVGASNTSCGADGSGGGLADTSANSVPHSRQQAGASTSTHTRQRGHCFNMAGAS